MNPQPMGTIRVRKMVVVVFKPLHWQRICSLAISNQHTHANGPQRREEEGAPCNDLLKGALTLPPRAFEGDTNSLVSGAAHDREGVTWG